MNFLVEPVASGQGRGSLRADLGSGVISAPCMLGAGGCLPSADKREGDGATPAGIWPIRKVFYRPDRVQKPVTAGAEVRKLSPSDGWCDAPDHPAYNRPVTLPFEASHERMWRDDRLYDIVVILGHNDDPPQPGLGSAIFWHLVASDWRPTAGCVAVTLPVMERLLRHCTPQSRMVIG